jgi:hypothetical protein
MAMGWLSVLKLVPWGDVIENAPKVAQGAKKLWGRVGKKPVVDASAPNPPGVSGVSARSNDEAAVAALAAQVAELQLASAELHQQMVESSALIQSLAEQNTQLILRLELHHKRLLALAVFTAVLGNALLVQYFR